ncbi:NAD(P)-dependent oxidoreductase [Salinibaculum salinum]|uniref:NAD-dependent epimerase/dehydratase family protein n=1 Tax=Salinibaculum salinum TaxID=3131996 RepID=UPI0030ED272B
MHVLVSGATGVFGHRIVDQLTDHGHTVFGLTRNDAGTSVVESHGGTPVVGDLLKPDTLETAVGERDVDVVVHAATRLPPETKTTAEYWERNDRVRLDGAKHLLDAVGDDIDQFVFPGVVWVARQPDGSTFDVNSPRHPSRSTQSAADVEDLLGEESDRQAFDATVIRMGFFYAPDGRHTRTFAENLLAGDLPIVGGGLLGRRDAELSLIHADDAARAVTVSVDESIAGLYHVVDDRPVTVAEYFRTFAELLDAPVPRRVPWWIARPLAGKDMVRFLTTPMPTISEKFRRATDWAPEYPTYCNGLQQIVRTWEDDGTLAAMRGEAAASGESVTVPTYRKHRG